MSPQQYFGSLALEALKQVGNFLLLVLEFVVTWLYRLRWYELLGATALAFAASLVALIRDASATYTEANFQPGVMSLYTGIFFGLMLFAYAHYHRGWMREPASERERGKIIEFRLDT